MTPKEKAKQLVDEFSIVGLQQRNEGIACALIAVDKIVKECSEWVGGDFSRWEQSRIDYWQEVKSEIENL